MVFSDSLPLFKLSVTRIFDDGLLPKWLKNWYMRLCACTSVAENLPVWAPRDGGDLTNIRKKDGVIFDAIQSIVHLTQWQSVELKL